jgi:ribosomal protein S2
VRVWPRAPQGRSIGASAWARPVLESAQSPNFTLRIIPGAMTQTDADKFLNRAEECLQQAERAISTRDKEEWLRLAEEWMKLARTAKERGI